MCVSAVVVGRSVIVVGRSVAVIRVECYCSGWKKDCCSMCECYCSG